MEIRRNTPVAPGALPAPTSSGNETTRTVGAAEGYRSPPGSRSLVPAPRDELSSDELDRVRALTEGDHHFHAEEREHKRPRVLRRCAARGSGVTRRGGGLR